MQKKELEKYALDLGILKLDIDLIISKNLSISRTELFLLSEIPKKYLKNIKKDFERKKSGEPIEYIIEKANFFGLDFFVNKNVLIPRNDTEVMIEKILNEKNLENYNLIDIGTGSGNIAISVKKNSKIQKVFALDISKNVLKITKKNIKDYKLEKEIILLKSDLLEEINFINSKLLTKNLIITANLPYIKNGDYKNMSLETIKYEPNLALFGGEHTGFELYEKLIYQIFDLKKQNNLEKIILFIEVGFDQKEIAKDFLIKKNLNFEIFKDNNLIDRCIKIEF